jgi:small-conductance mechanosensitive channel
MNSFWNDVIVVLAPFAFILTILLTIGIAVLARYILIKITNRVIRNIVDGVDKKTRKAERTGKPANLSPRAKKRAKTMGTVLNNTITWTIVIITLIIILQELGVSVVAIAASAGVATAVIGFGAQNVIKDILNGLFLVFEDQFGVGDEVDLGLATGTVEDVGVRITKIRDKDGVLWFVRNGEIVRVGNLSQAKKKK